MKRFLSIVLFIGMLTLSTGCFDILPHITTEDRPTTDEPTEHTTAAHTKQTTTVTAEQGGRYASQSSLPNSS